MLTKLNHFFINRQELYLGAKHDAGAPRTMARALLGAALLSLCGASKEFGLYDAEGTPGAGWALASAADLMTHRVAFVAQYNMLGLKIIKDFHSGNCCVATAGGLKLEIPGTPHGFQFLADAANGELQCNPSEGYPAGMAYKFMNQQTISSAATFADASACTTSHNPGVYMREAPTSASTVSSSSTSSSMEFGIYDLELKLSGGWRLMSAADLNAHSQAFITQYNKEGGIAVIQKYNSGNCCFALDGGDKLTVAGTPYGYQFPADANGDLQCSPPAGYTAATYKFFKTPTLPASTSFSSAPACVTNHNPALWGRVVLPPASTSAAGQVLEFGIYNSALAPGGGWALMSVADLETHREAFIQSYNDKGGLDVVALFSSNNCCFAIAGGTKLSISGTPYGYQFPAAASGGIRCNPSGGYSDARYHFYRTPMLPLNAEFSESTACATNHNPGVFMRWVDALSSSEVPAVPVDCEMSPWNAWGACSITCGGLGIKQRHRSVTVAPRYGGAPCNATVLASHCAFLDCPGDCAVSSWEPWTACTQTCGAPGSQSRSRSVISPSAHGGVGCPALAQTQECLLGPCPVHCQVSSFGDWSACTRSCGGGSQTRSRSVTQQAAHGGSVCPFLAQEQACNVHQCPANCELSGYGAPGACSKTCGGGQQQVSRSVLQPAQYGGSCPALTELWDCATGQCPVDCVLTPWGAWSSCSVTCGNSAPTTGQLSRARTMLVTPEHNGAPCATALTDAKSCNVTTLCPVHCTVSSWGQWSACSMTCGAGSKRRERHVVLERDNGGSVCPALDEEQACDHGVCPVHCEVSAWGTWTLCNANCGGGYQARRRQISVRPNYVVDVSIVCPALAQTRACNQQVDCAVHCQVSGWGNWGACGAAVGNAPAASCGNATRVRGRSVVVTASFNGAPCPLLSETRPCAMPTACRTACVMSSWGAWGACGKTCTTADTDVAVKWRSRTVAAAAVDGGAVCPPHLHDFTICRDLPSCSAAQNPYLAYFATESPTPTPSWAVPACPAGRYAVPPSEVNPFGLGDDECADCPAGRFQHAVGKPFCYYCPPDTVQPDAGASRCTACPARSIARGIGALQCTALPEPHLESHDKPEECAAGKYVVHDEVHDGAYCNFCCFGCPAGQFSAHAGATACTNCTAPAVQPKTGQSSCVEPAVALATAAPAPASSSAHLPRGMPGMVARLRLHNVSRSALAGGGAAGEQASLLQAVATALSWDVHRVELERAARHAPAPLTSAAPCSRFAVSGGGAVGTRSAETAGVYHAHGESGGMPSYRTQRCPATEPAAATALEADAAAQVPCRENYLYFLQAKGWWLIGPVLGSTRAIALSTAPDAVDPVDSGRPPAQATWHVSVSGGQWEVAPALAVACDPAPETDVWVRAVAQDCSAAEAARVQALAGRLATALPAGSWSPPFVVALRAGGISASRAEVVSQHTRLSCAPRVQLTLPVPHAAIAVPTTCHYDGSKLRVQHDSRSRVGPTGSFSCFHREDKATGIWRCQCQAWAPADAATVRR